MARSSAAAMIVMSAVAMALFGAAGCDGEVVYLPAPEAEGNNNNNNDNNNGADTGQEPEGPSNQVSDRMASVEVENYSSVYIGELYVAPCTNSSWGPNQLSAEIPPGYALTLSNLPPDCYDLLAVSAGGVFYWEEYGFRLTDGDHRSWSLFDAGA